MSEEKKQCDSKTCDKESCAGCSHAKGNGVPKENLNALSKITKVIGVVSGKGGVGKSMVTASLANEMAYHGYRVGIMDADITGPSIPRMYGLKGSAVADDNGIYPMVTGNDIKVMSINLLLPQEDAPVIWRGPILANMVKQFWTDVIWGELDYLFVDMPKVMSINLLLPQEDAPVIWRGPILANMVKQFWTDVIWGELDYLFVDMPPGTGDVPLTVFQSLPIDGIVIVSSPQELVQMIVKKAYNMAQMMQVPVFGLVENYSYVKCPDCGKKIYVLSSPQELVQMIVKKAYNMAQMMQVPVFGLVENYSYVKCPDCGKKIYVFGESKIDAAAAEVQVPVIGKMPLDPDIAASVDAGQFAGVLNTYLSGAGEFLPQV